MRTGNTQISLGSIHSHQTIPVNHVNPSVNVFVSGLLLLQLRPIELKLGVCSKNMRWARGYCLEVALQ